MGIGAGVGGRMVDRCGARYGPGLGPGDVEV